MISNREFLTDEYNRDLNLFVQDVIAAMASSNFINSNEFDSELVIGLVCSVGTETSLVIDLLRERLGRAGYRVELVKVSNDVIPQLVDIEDPGTDQFKRYWDLMTAGNACRELEPSDDSILAHGIATCISLLRQKHQGKKADDVKPNEMPVPKMAYIIDSLKRPEEVAKLRVIYSSGFLLLGIHSDLQRREEHLEPIRKPNWY